MDGIDREANGSQSGKSEGARGAYRILLAVSFVLAAAVFYPVWKALVFAAVVAAALDPLHERLALAWRQRRILSALVASTGVVVLVLLPLGGVIALAVKEAMDGVEFVRGALAASGGVPGLVDRLPSPIDGWAEQLMQTIAGNLSSEQAAGGGRWLATQLASAFSASSAVLFQTAIFVIALFFLFVDGRRLVAWTTHASPLGDEATRGLLVEFRAVSRAVLGSLLITATVQGVVATAGYLIAGVPQALFFGLLTWFAAFVPAVGTALVAAPLTAALFLTGHGYAALFLGIWALGVVGMVDSVLKPLIARRGMQLHVGVAFLAFLGGVVTWGVVGILVGPLAVSFFLAMVRLGLKSRGPGGPQQT